jgi:hypothetical protein
VQPVPLPTAARESGNAFRVPLIAMALIALVLWRRPGEKPGERPVRFE